MKHETMQEKLNKLLGIPTEVVEKVKEKTAKIEAKRQGKIIGITEDEIQEFRAAQGLIYFLQAPELFHPKVCKHCGADYLVSRIDVAYCSYTCIKNSLAELGIKWRKGADFDVAIEEVIQDKQVFNGNEPIWISNTQLLTRCLQRLQTIASSHSQPQPAETTKSSSTSEKLVKL